MVDEQTEQLLDVYRLMDWLGVSRPKVFQLKREKGLPFIKMGARTLRFDRKKVERWLEEQKQSA